MSKIKLNDKAKDYKPTDIALRFGIDKVSAFELFAGKTVDVPGDSARLMITEGFAASDDKVSEIKKKKVGGDNGDK